MILHSTFINAGTVILGSLLGYFLSKFFDKSRRLKRLPDALMKAVSLCVIFVGIKGAFDTDRFLVVLISLVLGTTIGTLIKIEELLIRFGGFIERRLVLKKKQDELDDEVQSHKNLSKAFVATTLTSCVGAMTVTGALNAGMGQGHSLLYAKSVLDLITAFVYSSAFGLGSILAVVPIVIYQGTIAIGADILSGVLTNSVNEISAVGSIMVVGLGLNMLGAVKIKVADMLPSVFLPILLCLIPWL